MVSKRPITFGYQRQAGKSRSHVAAIWGPPRRLSSFLGTKLKPKNFEFGPFLDPFPLAKSAIPDFSNIETWDLPKKILFVKDSF